MKILELNISKKPHELFETLSQQPYSFFLDSSEGSGYSFWGAEPYRVVDSLEDLEEEINLVNMQPLPKTLLQSPFIGGAVGFLSYEAARTWQKHLGPAKKEPFNTPDICFGFYDTFFMHDHSQKKTFLVSLELQADSRLKFDEFFKKANADNQKKRALRLIESNEIQSNLSKKQYLQMIRKAKKHIKLGNIYQVNLSQCLYSHSQKLPYSLYQSLRSLNPGNFSAYINLKDQQILCSSPERFIKVSQDKTIQTIPIKGTCPRGKTPKQDETLKQQLLQSEKNRAELMMIVDLQRNDLGKICEYGSVQVPTLCQLKSYASVHHLMSVIEGKLQTQNIQKIIQACFPGGSITGAPKLRAMQIIDELEPHNRGIYTGSIGYVDYRRQIDLNIAIRTMVCQRDMIYLPLGGGIVCDSSPCEEFDETLHKGQKMIEAVLH